MGNKYEVYSVSIPYRFNESLYKGIISMYNILFQFLIGSMKVANGSCFGASFILFQFLIGSMKERITNT